MSQPIPSRDELFGRIGASSALDRSDLSIGVALWLYSAEHEDWRFALASRQLDAAEPSEADGLVYRAFEAAGISPRTVEDLTAQRIRSARINRSPANPVVS